MSALSVCLSYSSVSSIALSVCIMHCKDQNQLGPASDKNLKCKAASEAFDKNQHKCICEIVGVVVLLLYLLLVLARLQPSLLPQ